MYLFHFSQYAWTDRVFRLDKKIWGVWDIVQLGTDAYGILLGDEIAWKEQVKNVWRSTNESPVIFSGVLSSDALQLINRFVHERYTTYKNSMWLWLHDIDDILKRIPKKKMKKSYMPTYNELSVEWVSLVSWVDTSWQQVCIFPDVRTMEQMMHSQELKKWEAILHGKSTKKQKSDVFRWVKTWTIHTLYCTYSQIFHDRYALNNIIIADAHKRYYKHHQDPRYDVQTVIEKMWEVYAANIMKTWFSL